MKRESTKKRVPFDRIECVPGKMSGQPCVKGTRLTVRRVVLLVAEYPERAELFREYPGLDDESVAQALRYAAAHLPDAVALPKAA